LGPCADDAVDPIEGLGQADLVKVPYLGAREASLDYRHPGLAALLLEGDLDVRIEAGSIRSRLRCGAGDVTRPVDDPELLGGLERPMRSTSGVLLADFFAGPLGRRPVRPSTRSRRRRRWTAFSLTCRLAPSQRPTCCASRRHRSLVILVAFAAAWLIDGSGPSGVVLYPLIVVGAYAHSRTIVTGQ
jgi:hypothetical protein